MRRQEVAGGDRGDAMVLVADEEQRIALLERVLLQLPVGLEGLESSTGKVAVGREHEVDCQHGALVKVFVLRERPLLDHLGEAQESNRLGWRSDGVVGPARRQWRYRAADRCFDVSATVLSFTVPLRRASTTGNRNRSRNEAPGGGGGGGGSGNNNANRNRARDLETFGPH